jgi:ParB family chromosome partitioning protein
VEEEEKRPEPKAKKPELPPVLYEIQKSLSSKLDVKVKINADERGRGNVQIPFKSQQDLKRIIDLL